MVDCWVETEALVESKYVALLIELSTELWWIHRVIVTSEVVSANRNLLHLSVLIDINKHVSRKKCGNNENTNMTDIK